MEAPDCTVKQKSAIESGVSLPTVHAVNPFGALPPGMTQYRVMAPVVRQILVIG
jgi:hypothetical protein